MKKTLPYLIGVCMLTLGLLVYSCSKRYEDPANFNAPNETAVPQDLLKAAENWHIQHTGVSASNKTVLSNGKKSFVLQPVWEKAKLQRTHNGKASIVAPSPEFALSARSKSGVVRKFIFDTEDDKITGGKIVELYADSAYISAHKRDLAERYNNNDMAGFTGAAITYDVNYKYLKSEVYKDGVLQTNMTAQLTRGKGGQTQGLGGKITLGRPITTLDYSCYDVYYVTTYWYDDYAYYQTWDYLYSYCTGSNNEYGGGGGGSGGGGGGSSTPIFGLNSSNAVVPIANFNSLIAYIQSTGLTVWEPFETVLTRNGIDYTGQVYQVTDSNGKLIVSYFRPDSNSSLFQTGNFYAVGNGNDPTPNPDNSTWSYLLGNIGQPGFDSNSITYLPSGFIDPVTGTNTTLTNAEPSVTSDSDPEIALWDNNPINYSTQSLPSWSLMYSNFPKSADGGEMKNVDVYNLVGGDVLAAYNGDHNKYANACAVRLSRALNYSGITIPNVPGVTTKGADNKYYFFSSIQMYNFMKKTFPNSNPKVLTTSDGGQNGELFPFKLAGHKGIYIMQPLSPALFQAYGHCTLYTGVSALGGHSYFNAKGGVKTITLWELP